MPDFATQAHGQNSAPAPAPSAGGGVDVRTLFLTACASAGAAYACSKIWAPGTLASAAFTPVLVAILKEALAKPTDVVARAVPVRGVVRSAPGQEPPEDRTARVPQAGELRSHTPSRRTRGWRLAVITGLLGFLVSAVVFTVPELVAGRSAGDGDRGTTIFGGGSAKSERSTTTTVPVKTTTAPATTVTAPATQTVTVPPATQTVTTPTTTAPATPTTTAPSDQANPEEPAVGAPPAAQPPG